MPLELLSNLLNGFAVSLTPANLFYCFSGVLFGTLVGMLPGIGTVSAISLLLPFSARLEPASALILFCSIYCGTKYGGSSTSILLNMPGETASIITCVDGYAMAHRGRAGAALAISAIASFAAGTLGLVGLTLFAPPLAELALRFGPPEYFGIVLTGAVIFIKMTGRSPAKTLLMALIGAILGTIGFDIFSGTSRFSYGFESLESGPNLALIAMGLFGVGELFTVMLTTQRFPSIKYTRVSELYPTREEYRRSAAPILRGGLLGFLLGLIPGPATTISSFASYALEKRISKNRAAFGNGAIEGVAGPEAANNAAVSGTMVPMLALGLPFGGTAAIILAGFLLHGLAPGPAFITQHPDIFWGLIASMYLGNCFLLLINYPLVLLLVQILRIPVSLLVPIIFLLTLTGAYTINRSIFDLLLIVAFGILGFLCKRTGYELSPLIIGIVMGPEIEQRLLQTFLLGQYTFSQFLRPLPLCILLAGAILIFLTFHPRLLKTKLPSASNLPQEDKRAK